MLYFRLEHQAWQRRQFDRSWLVMQPESFRLVRTVHWTGNLLTSFLIFFNLAALLSLGQCSVSTLVPPQAGTPAAIPQAPAATANAGNAVEPGSAIHWGARTKTSGCVYYGNGKLPDPDCTPGDLMSPLVTKEQICTSGYSSSVRDVPTSVKNEVYAEYGIASHAPGQYEIDHFVSLELGGSNDISNLFPEPASPKPGFHEKDKVENYLHDQVCSGAMTLQTAQIAIATNWLDVYDSMPSK